MTLADILKDTAKYGDAMVYTGPGGITTTLGELRQLSKKEQAAVSAKETEIAAREAALLQATNELQAAQRTTATLFAQTNELREQLVKQQPAAAAAATDPLDTLANDNIFGPVVKTIRQQDAALRAELKASQTAQAQLAESVKLMANSYVTDRLYDTYEQMVPADKRDKVSLDSLIKYAMDNKYNTRAGYVDIRKAYSDMTATERAASTEADMRKKITDEIMADLQSKGIQVRPPAGGGVPTGVLAGANQIASEYKNLDDAFGAAAKDAIWTQFNSSMPVS